MSLYAPYLMHKTQTSILCYIGKLQIKLFCISSLAGITCMNSNSDCIIIELTDWFHNKEKGFLTAH